MTTIIPHLAVATVLAGTHPATANILRTSTPSSAVGGATLLVLLIAFVFLACVVRITRQLGDLLSQLFRVAVSLVSTLIMIITVAALTVVVLLNR